MGISPARKYQEDGGPGARAIVELLRVHSIASADDEQTIVGALALNWLIAGVIRMAKAMSDLVADVTRRAKEDGLEHAMIGRLSMRLIGRARLCLKQLEN
jgi:hypothetical protein